MTRCSVAASQLLAIITLWAFLTAQGRISKFLISKISFSSGHQQKWVKSVWSSLSLKRVRRKWSANFDRSWRINPSISWNFFFEAKTQDYRNPKADKIFFFILPKSEKFRPTKKCKIMALLFAIVSGGGGLLFGSYFNLGVYVILVEQVNFFFCTQQILNLERISNFSPKIIKNVLSEEPNNFHHTDRILPLIIVNSWA